MSRPVFPVLLLTLALALQACGEGSAPPRPVTPLDLSTTGTIRGRVTFEGAPPPMPALPMGSDPGCAAQHAGPVLSGDALVHDGLVENAFVYIAEGLGERVFAVPSDPVTMDQRGCIYRPRVLGAQAGQPIRFLNSDPLPHNVHGTPAASSAWNFGMGVQGASRTIRVAKPEVMISVRCDVHPWMQGWIGVLDHPYFAVTGADGRFTLAEVPPGDYVVAVWHERFGRGQSRVQLEPRGAREVAFGFRGSPVRPAPAGN